MENLRAMQRERRVIQTHIKTLSKITILCLFFPSGRTSVFAVDEDTGGTATPCKE